MGRSVCRLDQDTADGIAESSLVMLGDGCPVATAWSLALQLNMKLVCLAADSFVARTTHIHGVRRDSVPEAQGCPLPPPSAKLALVEIDVMKSLVLGQTFVFWRLEHQRSARLLEHHRDVARNRATSYLVSRPHGTVAKETNQVAVRQKVVEAAYIVA